MLQRIERLGETRPERGQFSNHFISFFISFHVFFISFHVFVRPCGHSSFRTNETRHMAEIHEVKHTAEITTRNKTHGRDKEQRTTKLLPDKIKNRYSNMREVSAYAEVRF